MHLSCPGLNIRWDAVVLITLAFKDFGMTSFEEGLGVGVEVVVDDVFVDGLEGVFWTIEVIEIVIMLVLDKVFGQGLQELKIDGDGLLVHADSQNLVNISSHGVMNLICNLFTILIDVAGIEDGFILWIELNHGEGITISLC